jgi:hypothetical protein
LPSSAAKTRGEGHFNEQPQMLLGEKFMDLGYVMNPAWTSAMQEMDEFKFSEHAGIHLSMNLADQNGTCMICGDKCCQTITVRL